MLFQLLIVYSVFFCILLLYQKILRNYYHAKPAFICINFIFFSVLKYGAQTKLG